MKNIKNLYRADWVQNAAREPLRKEDILFRSVSSAESDACETNGGIGRATEYTYAEGYRRAGRILADYLRQNTFEADFLIFPLVFLYRHHVELQLKRLIPIASSLAGQVPTPNDRDQMGKHQLDRLWEILEPLLRELATKGFFITADDIEALDSYIRQIHSIDKGSFSFRYLASKTGQPSIDNHKHPYINGSVAAEGLEKLANYLFGLGELLDKASQLNGEIEHDAYDGY